jgi:hypothetical protein
VVSTYAEHRTGLATQHDITRLEPHAGLAKGFHLSDPCLLLLPSTQPSFPSCRLPPPPPRSCPCCPPQLGITHLQMLGIMRLMGLSWPSSAETMLTYADQTLPVVGWLNLDCISPRVGGLPRPLARVLLQLLVPGEACRGREGRGGSWCRSLLQMQVLGWGPRVVCQG